MDSENRQWMVLLVRLYVGGALFLAGLSKLFGVGIFQFYTAIQNKFAGTMLAFFPVQFLMFLPFLELLLGAFLILGVDRRRSLLVAAVLAFLHSQVSYLVGDVAPAMLNGVYFLSLLAALASLTEPYLALDTVIGETE